MFILRPDDPRAQELRKLFVRAILSPLCNLCRHFSRSLFTQSTLRARVRVYALAHASVRVCVCECWRMFACVRMCDVCVCVHVCARMPVQLDAKTSVLDLVCFGSQIFFHLLLQFRSKCCTWGFFDQMKVLLLGVE
jgi:hypothetical protein